MKKRRSNHAGSVVERGDGRWEARVSLPGGKRKSKYAKTSKEAEKILRELLSDLDKGIVPADGRQTVKQFLMYWLESVESRVEPSTFISYRTQLKRIYEGLGSVALSKLTAQQLQSFYAKKLAEGSASASVHLMHTVFKSALDEAVSLDIIPRNVARLVKAPKSQPKERVPLTEHQALSLLKVARGSSLEALYVLVLATGMREGELLALQWQDIDFEARELYITHGLQITPHGFRVTHPKSESSKRRIVLSPHVVEALQQHQQRQNEARIQAGMNWDITHDFVFSNRVGRRMFPTDFRVRYFRPLLRKASLPPIHFHDLRHTAATLLLKKGVHIKVVSEMLGHANIGITLRLYAHVMPGMQQQAADAASELFGDYQHRED